MSNFRLICITALSTMAMMAAAGAAAAQPATPAEQSGKPYLAGLRPPHDHRGPAHPKTSQLGTQHTPIAKSARVATRRRAVTAKVNLHRPVRLADKINSRVAWPSVKPPAADERDASDTVLQFATEETVPIPAPALHPATSAPASTIKPVSPAAIAATDERKVDSDITGTTPSASAPVQTERFEAPVTGQMRVIMPATNAEPLAAPAPLDQPPPRGSLITAQTLATLAGASAAGIIGWLMIGLGPFRTIRSRQT